MLKRSISSLALRRLVDELQVLRGAHFQKAYQLDYDTLVLRFSVRKEALRPFAAVSPLARSVLEDRPKPAPGVPEGPGDDEMQEGTYSKVFLHIRMGGFMFATPGQEGEMPKEPSPFAMKLRSSLGNRRLASISQSGLERMVELVFEGDRDKGMERKLYVELFGDGNAVLVNGGTIEAPFTSRTWSTRILKRGEPFQGPPSGPDPSNLTLEGLSSAMDSSGEDLVHFLIRRCGLPPVHAEEVCLRAGLERRTAASLLGPERRREVHETIRGLIEEVQQGDGAYVHFMDGAPELVEPLPIWSFFRTDAGQSPHPPAPVPAPLPKGPSMVKAASMNNALEQYMTGTGPSKRTMDRSMEKEKERLLRQLEEQRAAKVTALRDAERYKELGDLLYLKYAEVSDLLVSFDPEMFHADRSLFPTVVTHSAEGPAGRGRIVVRLGPEGPGGEAELELDKDINGNANSLYELSKKERRHEQGLDLAIQATERKLAELEEVEELGAEMGMDLQHGGKGGRRLRSFWFESFRWCFSSDGVLIIAGRDARSNEKLVKRYMREEDLYAHADISGASSVVIRVEKDVAVPERTKEEGCHLSVLHSKAWHSKVGAASAYWVMSHQVSRTPQSGEFVAKGSFIIRGKKNLVDKLPLVGAIGTIYIEGVPKAMFGPESAVSARCAGTYYRITPGRTKKTDAAKVIAGSLGCELDQALSVLPSSDMDIARVERAPAE